MKGLRPEAVALLLRWAEPAVTGLLALWLAWVSIGALRTGSPTLLLTLIGTVLSGLWCAVALMRAVVRRKTGQDHPGGPGVVTIQEGRIGYYGPEGGGFIVIDELMRVDLVAAGERGGDALDWRFRDADGQVLQVPAEAEGAEKILDAIGVLKDIDYPSLVSAMFAKGVAIHTVWRRSRAISAP
ncbi:MAG: hypothetical protein AAGE80_10400 [Pseudomonadota bacterium]